MFCFLFVLFYGFDLFVVIVVCICLVCDGQNYWLFIIGNKLISELIFMIGLCVGCGVDLQCDYVLMLQVLLMLVEVDSGVLLVVVIMLLKKGNFCEWCVCDGDMLESIVEL